ncbi:MAG: phosphoribosylglycinamide formyltransferase [Bacteroidota bacterium]|nr:phosphoribosylglycinamide formyltransferase [Bacteroidota bacterium]
MQKIALFASGNGTNAQRITEYFKDSTEISVDIILSNNPKAYVLQRAASLQVPTRVFDRREFYDTRSILKLLKEREISFIVLAGFLWLVPDYLLKAYSHRIINIHPALLPKYGGKGMYGIKVHEAVIQSGDKESGITIHYVNDKYDAGEIIFQAKCSVLPGDSPEMLAQKIHFLEYEHFPVIIRKVIMEQTSA